MAHPNILDRSKAALLLVDIQEAFRSAIGDFAVAASRAAMAVRGFQVLDVPIFVTEQYPKGLGRTAEEIILTLPADFDFIEKTAFSSCGADQLVDGLNAANIEQVVLCGFEAHVCVNQTAHDLLERGFQVHLLTDSVASRFDHDRTAGIAKMLASGVISSSVEMSLFELMRDAKHEKFKEIQSIIK